MKQGSTDDPFADDTDEQDSESTRSRSATTGETPDTQEDQSVSSEGNSERRSLPYIHSRDSVKDGRTQRPVFLRDHVEAGIDELVSDMEERFDDDVYKSDVTEAAMVVAQQHPELVYETLEEWGYGWD